MAGEAAAVAASPQADAAAELQAAITQHRAGRFDEAEAIYRELVAYRRKTEIADSIVLSDALSSLSECVLRQAVKAAENLVAVLHGQPRLVTMRSDDRCEVVPRY